MGLLGKYFHVQMIADTLLCHCQRYWVNTHAWLNAAVWRSISCAFCFEVSCVREDFAGQLLGVSHYCVYGIAISCIYNKNSMWTETINPNNRDIMNYSWHSNFVHIVFCYSWWIKSCASSPIVIQWCTHITLWLVSELRVFMTHWPVWYVCT